MFLFVTVAASIGFATTAAAVEMLPGAPTHPVTIVGDAARGRAMAERWCLSCHLPADNVASTDSAPSFQWVAQQVKRNPDHIRVFLTHPHKPMPPLDLDRGQIEDLIAYFGEIAKQ